MNTQITIFLAVFASAMIAAGGCGNKQAGDNDRGSQSMHEDHAGHAGEHQEEDDAGHDEHGGDVVKLTADQIRISGVVLAPLGGGEIVTHIMLPAEVGLNQDTVVHVTPRVAGIVSSVDGFLGHDVQTNELLAVLESPELGEAKISYLQLNQMRAIAATELERQVEISKNTDELLKVLRSEPSVESLHKQVEGLRIGVNKGRLLSAYIQMKSGNARYVIEKDLDERGLTTKAELLAAQEVWLRARSQYMARFEEVDFSFRVQLQEAQQSAVVASLAVENAQRRLYLYGLTQEQIEQVIVEPEQNVARYELFSPTNGRLVSKHITPGEMVEADASVYTIADLSTVWLNVSIYSEYANAIKVGQQVIVQNGNRVASGVVDYMSAIISESTRTLDARVVLDNKDGAWRPGVFTTVRIEMNQSYVERVVPIDAVQTFEGHTVVFVQDDDGIKPVAVTLGRKNDDQVELLGDDIELGAMVVVENSFLMKAELGKSSAGHQH